MIIIPMKQLCYADKTIYAVDDNGRVWFINTKTGDWCLYGNPTRDDLNEEQK